MLFTLQKMIWFLILPPASLIIIMITGLIILNRRKRLGRMLMIFSITLLYVLSLGHVSDMLLRPLESFAPPLQQLPDAADAVIVPGGGSVDLEWISADPVPNSETYTRLIKGIELAKKLDIPLVLTGGNGEPFATRLIDADVMAEVAYDLGILQDQTIVENCSRNTLENSHEVRKVVKGDRIILVTSSYYMRRAAAMFTKRGFTVIPAPTFQLVQTRPLNLSALIPRSGNLLSSTVALAEWISLIWWGIRGEL